MNHFHFLTYSKSTIVPEKFSGDLRVMLRSYARAINIQENRTGSLFQQHTKIKPLEAESHTMTPSHSMTNPQPEDQYPFTCFHYIHQNPVKAKPVRRMEDWEMSSFQDYAGLRNGSLCNKQIAHEFLEMPVSPKRFINQSYKVKIE